MLWVSGSEAHYVARTLNMAIFESYSVARMDLQVTMTSLDADYMIEYIQPSKVYKATKIVNLNGKGTTLYVGAPTSNLRLRVYNKTAESGIAPILEGNMCVSNCNVVINTQIKPLSRLETIWYALSI